jgi:enoyl-[acyl-carrier protein] reductase II
LKSDRTAAIHEQGVMSFDDMKGILNVYFQGDMEAAPALAGQSAGLIDSVKTAKDIIDSTVAQFFEISERMGAMAKRQSFDAS